MGALTFPRFLIIYHFFSERFIVIFRLCVVCVMEDADSNV